MESRSRNFSDYGQLKTQSERRDFFGVSQKLVMYGTRIIVPILGALHYQSNSENNWVMTTWHP